MSENIVSSNSGGSAGLNHSVIYDGGANEVKLDGDLVTPGSDMVYGTSSTGVKGWQGPFVVANMYGGDTKRSATITQNAASVVTDNAVLKSWAWTRAGDPIVTPAAPAGYKWAATISFTSGPYNSGTITNAGVLKHRSLVYIGGTANDLAGNGGYKKSGSLYHTNTSNDQGRTFLASYVQQVLLNPSSSTNITYEESMVMAKSDVVGETSWTWDTQYSYILTLVKG